MISLILITAAVGLLILLAYLIGIHSAKKCENEEMEWIGNNYERVHGGWIIKYSNQDGRRVLSTDEVRKRYGVVMEMFARIDGHSPAASTETEKSLSDDSHY